MDMRQILAGFLMAPLFTVAAATVPPAAAPLAEKARSADEKVCEMRRELGSQRVKRVCTTAAERDAAKEKAARALNPGGRCSAQDSYCNSGL